MNESVRCPDCGHVNPAGSTSCEVCNFPLTDEPFAAPPAAETQAAESHPAGGTAVAAGSATAHAGDAGSEGVTSPAGAYIPTPLRRPMRRPRPPSNQALSLWLMFGFIAAAAVTYIAIKANLDRASQPVEGSSDDQQKRADVFRAALAKDSTNIDARIGLGNVLYDTGNWSEAIVQYRSAVRQDSSRATTLVDLGVCYYNLGDAGDAEDLFVLALQRDPHQPIALFNLGIVSEKRSDYANALKYFHRALESGPPEEMKQALIEAMGRVQKATGKTAPPLPDGR